MNSLAEISAELNNVESIASRQKVVMLCSYVKADRRAGLKTKKG
jgi:hypothetical protein